MTEEEIVKDFPELTREDIKDSLAFAADREGHLMAVHAWSCCWIKRGHLGWPSCSHRRWTRRASLAGSKRVQNLSRRIPALLLIKSPEVSGDWGRLGATEVHDIDGYYSPMTRKRRPPPT